MIANLLPTFRPSAAGLNLLVWKKSTFAVSLNPKDAMVCVSSINVSSASFTVTTTSSNLKKES